MAKFDLVLKNGLVIDPALSINSVMDIAFKEGRVADLAHSISGKNANEVKNVSGCILTPGLIDLHTHVYKGGTSIGIAPDEYCSNSAVTTVIDTGSAGPGNFEGFRDHVIKKATVRVLAFLHVSHAGIFGFSENVMVGESEDLRLMDPISAVKVVKANTDLIVGIKVRLGKWASGTQGMTPFHYARQVAETTNLPLMVHIDHPPPSYREVVSSLNKGDILTHCFRPFPNSPVLEDGEILPEVLAAREKGVYFDIGHGMASFSFNVAKKMIDQKFFPDTISSDVHAMCVNGPVYDLLVTMSKFYYLGMPMEEIVRATTETPARILSRDTLGSFQKGSPGDASILKLESGSFNFSDSEGYEVVGQNRFTKQGLVINGRLWDGLV